MSEHKEIVRTYVGRTVSQFIGVFNALHYYARLKSHFLHGDTDFNSMCMNRMLKSKLLQN